jgi:ubiquinone/menaquinone biosynthesis C-methylase UbiE
MLKPNRGAAWLVAVCCAIVPATLGQEGHRHGAHAHESNEGYIRALEDPSREAWQQPDRVVQMLNVHPGEEVADLGAGSGYFTLRLAQEVGSAGKVYALDVEKDMLAQIERRAEEEGLQNIETILSDPDDPKLGSRSVDLIFICNVLHHIENRAAYYPYLLRALRPGGRLVNIDFHKRELPLGPPVEMKIEKRECIREIEAAGFRLVEDLDLLEYQYFLIFERAEP